MAIRYIRVFSQKKDIDKIKQSIKEHSLSFLGIEEINEEKVAFDFLSEADKAEPILDWLEDTVGYREGFQIVLLPVEAVIPPIEETKEPEKKQEPTTPESKKEILNRLSREELRSDILDLTKISGIYLIMVIISAIVAGIGLLRGNTAVVIGAMVIAPLLGPNVALSFATTLADFELVKRSILALIVGVLSAFLVSVTWGLFIDVDPSIPEIASRTVINISDITLALASGTAGVLAITTGTATNLVGVMVAIALLPPIVASGLLVGSGHFSMAIGAALIFFNNIICINLAGIITFHILGIRPRTWWKEEKAKKAVRYSLIIWGFLLLILVTLIIYFYR